MKNNKRCLLSVALIILLLLSSCLMCACVDYEYSYYFSVEGGNGTISMFADDKLFESDNSPVQLMGGRQGMQQFAFLATPSEGYRVKQWTCDGQIVHGNKTVIYMCDKLTPTKGEVHITVEFEPIETIISDIQAAYIKDVLNNNQTVQGEIDVTVYHSTDNAVFALINRETQIRESMDFCLDKCFPNVNGIFWVFSGNKLYQLESALRKNIISESEFYDFVAKCNSTECKPCVSSFKHEIQLNEDLQNEIIQKYLEKYHSGKDNIDVEELSVRCLGDFEKCQVVFIDGPFLYLTWETYDSVGNVIFRYSTSHQLKAYKDGEFYSLSQAYLNGYITEAEALTIK